MNILSFSSTSSIYFIRFLYKNLLLALCLIFPITLLAENVADNVTELVLSNGLKVVVKPDHRSPAVVFQIWYKVGSSYEYEGISGISHMLEHLMFIANKNALLGESFNHLNDIGAKGNAYTSRDYTYYYHLMAKQHLSLAFAMEAERMQNLSPSISEFTIEKKVIKEELYRAIGKEPYLLAHNALYKNAFKNSAYQFPVIGLLKDVNTLTLEKTMLWYKNHYTPDNATIVVVGDINAEEVFNLARKYFAAITKPRRLVINQPAAKETQKAEIRFIMPETIKVGGLLVAFKVPSINTSMPLWEAYALEVLAGWLETGTLSRLTRVLIRDKHLAHEITISYSPVHRLDSLFIIEAIPALGVSLKQLEKALVEEIAHIKNEIISQKTLQKIKNQMIATDIFERDSIYTQAKIIGKAESAGIHWSEDARYLARIKAVTAQQVKYVLQKYFVSAKKIVVVQNSYNDKEQE